MGLCVCRPYAWFRASAHQFLQRTRLLSHRRHDIQMSPAREGLQVEASRARVSLARHNWDSVGYWCGCSFFMVRANDLENMMTKVL